MFLCRCGLDWRLEFSLWNFSFLPPPPSHLRRNAPASRKGGPRYSLLSFCPTRRKANAAKRISAAIAGGAHRTWPSSIPRQPMSVPGAHILAHTVAPGVRDEHTTRTVAPPIFPRWPGVDGARLSCVSRAVMAAKSSVSAFRVKPGMTTYAPSTTSFAFLPVAFSHGYQCAGATRLHSPDIRARSGSDREHAHLAPLDDTDIRTESGSDRSLQKVEPL